VYFVLQMLAEAVRTASQIPQGFKELIQKRCEERGIVFMPLPNRYREGKQVYRCGKIQIYIDRSVVFVSENGSAWNPTSLNNMLDMAA
jgi:tuftelin-interacting protein 11